MLDRIWHHYHRNQNIWFLLEFLTWDIFLPEATLLATAWKTAFVEGCLFKADKDVDLLTQLNVGLTSARASPSAC